MLHSSLVAARLHHSLVAVRLQHHGMSPRTLGNLPHICTTFCGNLPPCVQNLDCKWCPEDVNLSPEIVSLVMTVDPTKRLTQRRRSLMNGLEKRQRYLQQYTVNTRLPNLRVSWARYASLIAQEERSR